MALSWVYIWCLLVTNEFPGSSPFRTVINNNAVASGLGRFEKRSAVNAKIGKEALQKLLRQTRVMYSNGYDTFFWKQGGYEQALRDFQSIDPKLLNGNRHKGEITGSKGNLVLRVSNPDGESPRLSIEIHKIYHEQPTDPPQEYFIFYND